MALRHRSNNIVNNRPYNIPDRYRGVVDELFDNIDPIATIEAGSNILGHTWEYWNEQGDFARPAKWQKTEGAQAMEADSTNQIEAPPTAEAQRLGGSSGAAPGPKGALVGRTQTKRQYEAYFHERQWAHSKKVRTVTFLWGFSTFDQPTYNDNYKIELKRFGKSGLTCMETDALFKDNTNIWKPWIFGDTSNNKNLSDLTLANSLNLYVDDFYDKKLYDNAKKTGIFTNFNKLRLKSITVTITPRTYYGGVMNQAHWLFAKTEKNEMPSGGDKKYFPAYYEFRDIKEMDMEYYVYRDLYGAYHKTISGDQLIPDTPPDAEAAAAPALSRTCRTIRAHDNNLEIMSNRKPFSFTREVSSTGNYFITPATLNTKRTSPIHSIINELEGQIGTSTYINKFPEYLGLLIVPRFMPINIYGQLVVGGSAASPSKGYIVDSAFHTILECKFNATWECFDFKHGDYSPVPTLFTSETTREIDPLIYAERDYAAAKELENMQLNTN